MSVLSSPRISMPEFLDTNFGCLEVLKVNGYSNGRHMWCVVPSFYHMENCADSFSLHDRKTDGITCDLCEL